MRSEKYKQMIAICEDNAEAFQEKMNDALARVADPEIAFDNNRSFTAYVTFRVRKDVPENVLELFELLDGDSHYCSECPHFCIPSDKRKRWGSCTLKIQKTRSDSRACEHFYVWRLKQLEQMSEEYKQIPYEIED